MFRVIPRSKSYTAQAKILEAVLNRPEVADRIIDELGKILKERTEAILTSYPQDNTIFGQGRL